MWKPWETLSWRGSQELKADVLAQMRAHHAGRCLSSLTVSGVELSIYGWTTHRDTPKVSQALGIPARLLSIGNYLFEGFPEDPLGTAEHIEGIREFFAAIPVGRDLEGIAEDLLATWLLDERWGVAARSWEPQIIDRLESIAISLLDGEVDTTALAAHRASVEAEIVRQWQTCRAVDNEQQLARTLLEMLETMLGEVDGPYSVLSGWCSKEAEHTLRNRLLNALAIA